MQTFSVHADQTNERIDVALSHLMDAYSRMAVQKLIRKGLVKVNGKVAKKGSRVVAEDIIQVIVPPLQDSSFKATDIPLHILYEDDDLLVVVKPAGLLTHPSAHERTTTLVNALLHHCGDRLSGIGGERRPGIVHRLDKDTSGILVIAKHDESHRDLAKQIQDRLVEKHYLALVDGVMESPEGTIDSPLLKTRPKRGSTKVVVSPHQEAKASLTHFSVREVFQDRFSLLDVQIITGRMHQIRVHLSALHHPVIGDQLYGHKKTNTLFVKRGLARQFLHSFRLKFRHPRTHKWMEFEAALPKDLQTIVDQLKADDLILE